MELRDKEGNLFGVVDDETKIFEVSCKSRWCGKRPGVVIIHRFDLETGELISTEEFRDPTPR